MASQVRMAQDNQTSSKTNPNMVRRVKANQLVKQVPGDDDLNFLIKSSEIGST